MQLVEESDGLVEEVVLECGFSGLDAPVPLSRQQDRSIRTQLRNGWI